MSSMDELGVAAEDAKKLQGVLAAGAAKAAAAGAAAPEELKGPPRRVVLVPSAGPLESRPGHLD